MKKQIAVITAALLMTGLASSISYAGPARRHTIEGFVLGAGVTLLGSAIIHNMSRQNPPVAYAPPPPARHRHTPPPPRDCRGHWETRKAWVPPQYETRWNPAHYNKHGEWVRGRYQDILVAEGYWQAERVWVESRRYR